VVSARVRASLRLASLRKHVARYGERKRISKRETRALKNSVPHPPKNRKMGIISVKGGKRGKAERERGGGGEGEGTG
jgi:hypothetical protein